MRILLISFFFPPYNVIGAVRNAKMAKYLRSFGHDVEVLSADRQNVMRSDLSTELPAERIHYTHWLNPRWPLDLIFGRGEKISFAGNAAVTGPEGSAGLLSRMISLVKTVVYFPDPQIGWLPFACAKASSVMRKRRPDVIYASAPPFTGLMIAARVGGRHGIPWVADFRDLWVDNECYDYPPWRLECEEKVERRTVSKAAAMVTVSEPLAELLRSKYGKTVRVIPNGFDACDYPGQVGPQSERGELLIVYTGNIYPERQSPRPLFEAIRMMGPTAGKIKVRFYGVRQRDIGHLDAGCGIPENVEFRPPVSHREALGLQAGADLLLHLLWNDPGQPGIYSGKLFEYLGARRPVLALGSVDNVAARLIRERSAGLVSDDPGAIRDYLEGMLLRKEAEGCIPPLPPAVGSGFSREEQARSLEELLKEVCMRNEKRDGIEVAG